MSDESNAPRTGRLFVTLALGAVLAQSILFNEGFDAPGAIVGISFAAFAAGWLIGAWGELTSWLRD